MEICDYIYGSYDAGKIRTYMLWGGTQWIRASAGEYSMDGCRVLFALGKFHFLALKLIFGTRKKKTPRWQKCLMATERILSMCEESLAAPDRTTS